MTVLTKTLKAPKRPLQLPSTIKWLSGEGAGSWFLIEETGTDNQYLITRFSPEGLFECKGTFLSSNVLDLSMDYQLSYPSNCLKVTVVQSEMEIQLNREND